MHSFLCEYFIDFDARQKYQASDIEQLLIQVQNRNQSMELEKVVVLLKNAHYLTTKAFVVLYDYIRQNPSINVIFIVSGDKSKIFPPLLDCLENENITRNS